VLESRKRSRTRLPVTGGAGVNVQPEAHLATVLRSLAVDLTTTFDGGIGNGSDLNDSFISKSPGL
jgi:hypothetical protein